tara:strand:- start:25 stop:261 length:237 start_codon:yes stop_codon:yes gene_type:complete
MQNNLTKRALPFECAILDKEPQLVANPYTGDEVLLKPDAIAVYDCIKGSELVKDWETVQKGLDWFREHECKAYYVLLD